VHDFPRRPFDVRNIPLARRHDEIVWGTMRGAGLLAWFFFTILAPEQFSLKLLFCHEEGFN
jgi:hypothetical protein